jgi:hypothetical protein
MNDGSYHHGNHFIAATAQGFLHDRSPDLVHAADDGSSAFEQG